MKRLTRRLVDSSIEAYILALETINRPSVRYRVESFCFLFCNSWELLLKARLLDSGEKIFHQKKRKQPRRSLSLDECLDRLFLFQSDPVKLNIVKISELRNNATHLVIPFVPPDIMGLFQAGVVNYPRFVQDWFHVSISDRVPLGMMVLVYDFDPKLHSLDHARIARRLSADTVRWLEAFQRDIREQAAMLGDKTPQFYIPIDLKLALVANPNKADIVLSKGPAGQSGIQNAVVVEVPKDSDKTHPYRRKELVPVVNQKLGGLATLSAHDISCIVDVFGLKDRLEFYRKPKYSSPTVQRSICRLDCRARQ